MKSAARWQPASTNGAVELGPKERVRSIVGDVAGWLFHRNSRVLSDDVGTKDVVGEDETALRRVRRCPRSGPRPMITSLS
jgi:hypothetical protein